MVTETEESKTKRNGGIVLDLFTEYVASALPRSALVLTIKAEHSAREIPVSEQASAAHSGRVKPKP